MSAPAARPALEQTRVEIERIDREIIALVAERVRLARSLGDLKRADRQPLLDPAREAAVIRRAASLAAEADLPVEPLRAIFWHIIGLCRRAQEQ